MSIAEEIFKILNEKTGCKLTENFNGEVEHTVRLYELMSIKNGIEVSIEIVEATQVPLLLLANAYQEDSEIYEAACNEIAYTVLNLINIPIRNLFVKTVGQNIDFATRMDAAQELKKIFSIFSYLEKYKMGPKTMKLYEEICEIQQSTMENLNTAK